jgi:uncharacterized membrane protein
METFSTSMALRFGWETFKQRPWFLAGATLLGFVLTVATSAIDQRSNTGIGLAVLLFFVSLGLSTLIDMGITAFVLRAHDDVTHVSLMELWHPKPFWHYLAAALLVGFAVIIGFVLLIIPGIILILMFAFVKFIVIDRNLGPIEAMKESARITHGHRLELLLLYLALLGLNILGFVAFIVGLLLTGPISILALAHAYRTLSHTVSNIPNTSSVSS